MNKKQWRPVQRIEQQYTTLLKKLLAPIEKEIKRNGTSVDKVIQILNNTTQSKTYNKKAQEIAKTISTMLWEDGAKNWRQAAKKSSRGREINNLLRSELQGHTLFRFEQLIDQNAHLIKTLPLDISQEVVKHITSKNIEGTRASDISKEIKAFFPERTKAKAELIARTETSKTSSALTQVRSEELGVDWAVWNTSEDGRVRSTHKHMEGIIFSYNNKPSPEKLDPKYKGKNYGNYGPGEIFNCRCYASPLIDKEDVKWPHKVYYNGKIEMMTLNKFLEIGGNFFSE